MRIVPFLGSFLPTTDTLHRRGKHSAQKIFHARALLLCDTSDNSITRTVESVADAVGVSCRTIEHIKQRFVEDSIESALTRKPASKPPLEILFDGAFEAKLLTLACSHAPEGVLPLDNATPCRQSS